MTGQKIFVTLCILFAWMLIGIGFINAYPIIGRPAEEALVPFVVFLVISALVVNGAIILAWRNIK